MKMKERMKTTGWRLKGGPSVAPSLADSGGAMEGSRIRMKIKIKMK